MSAHMRIAALLSGRLQRASLATLVYLVRGFQCVVSVGLEVLKHEWASVRNNQARD